VASRERRAQARAALSPQTTGASETNLIDHQMQRLKLEGTPRPKRERRTPASALSLLPITADYSDFMLSNRGLANSDMDLGSMAQKMMNGIFEKNGLEHDERVHTFNGQEEEKIRSPISPSPVMGDPGMLGEGSPMSPSPLARVEEDDPEEQLDDEEEDEEGMEELEDGDRTAREESP